MAEWDAEVDVDERLARELIVSRFPALDATALRRIGEGWDNVVWATADDVAFRFPRRQIAVAGVQREIALLPALAPRLPLAIPDAAYPGAPSDRYGWPWFGSRLIAGREIATTRLGDAARIALAARLGGFLRVLHGLRLDDATSSLPVDPFDRAHMAVLVPKTRAVLHTIAALWTAPAGIEDLLAAAQRLPAPQATALVHGDLHLRHLLVDEAGALAGVIDWGDVCRAHPAVDLSLYWSLLTAAGREAFRAAYDPMDEQTLVRARIFALYSSAMLVAYAHAEGIPELEREALAGLDRTLAG